MSQTTNSTAILVTDWHEGESSAFAQDTDPVLISLLGKSLLERTVENLARAGYRQVHILLGDIATGRRIFLGSGERWGISIACHYRNSVLSLGENLKRLNLREDQVYRLATTDQLPQTCPDNPGHEAAAYCHDRDGRMHWTGWGDFSGDWLLHSPATDYAELEKLVLSDTQIRLVSVEAPISANSPQAVWDCVRRLFSLQERDVVKGRGCRIHPSARLIGPVHLGNFVRIGPNVTLGPHGTLGDGCLIGQGSHLEQCVVLADTYIGEELEVRRAIVSPSQYSSLDNDVTLTRLEPTLVAGVTQRTNAVREDIALRFTIALLMVMIWPVHALARLMLRPRNEQKSMEIPVCTGGTLQLPLQNTTQEVRSGQAGAWFRHFTLTFYPGLRYVSQGYLSFIGPELRDTRTIRELPKEWQMVYSKHRPGLLSESIFLSNAEDHELSHFSSDAYSASLQSRKASICLLLRYMGRVFRDMKNLSVQ